MEKVYYFDSVSTTKVDDEIIDLHHKLLTKYYANADALHDYGLEVYRMHQKAKAMIAQTLNIDKQEIIFTSGASESNNLAIKGLFFKHYLTRNEIIVSPYEHSSVHNVLKQLERLFGAKIIYLKLKANGQIDFKHLETVLSPKTLMVCVMAVNNEVGIINDVAKIMHYVKKHSQAYTFSDCSQAITKIPLNFENIDLVSFSAHKIHGLKASGVLIKKRHVTIEPLIVGGQQNQSLRAGTSDYIKDICLAKILVKEYGLMVEKRRLLMNYIRP